MATRAIRTGIDPVDLESDYTKYNFGIKNLWEGLVPKYEGTPLQAQGISLESVIAPKDNSADVLQVLTEPIGGSGSDGSSQGSQGNQSQSESQSNNANSGFTGYGNRTGGLIGTAVSMGVGALTGSPTAGRAAGGIVGSYAKDGEIGPEDVVDIGLVVAAPPVGLVNTVLGLFGLETLGAYLTGNTLSFKSEADQGIKGQTPSFGEDEVEGTPSVNTPGYDPAAYTGPKAAEALEAKADPVAEAMNAASAAASSAGYGESNPDAQGNYGDQAYGGYATSNGPSNDSNTNADGNTTGGGATSSDSSGEGNE